MMYLGILKFTAETVMCQICFMWNILHIRNGPKHAGRHVLNMKLCTEIFV